MFFLKNTLRLLIKILIVKSNFGSHIYRGEFNWNFIYGTIRHRPEDWSGGSPYLTPMRPICELKESNRSVYIPVLLQNVRNEFVETACFMARKYYQRRFGNL